MSVLPHALEYTNLPFRIMASCALEKPCAMSDDIMSSMSSRDSGRIPSSSGLPEITTG